MTASLHTSESPAPVGAGAAPPEIPLQHAEALAHQLVRRLGLNAARKTCAENHWLAVLDVINLMHRDV